MDYLLPEQLEIVFLKGNRKGQKDLYSYDVIYDELTKDGRQTLFRQFHNQYQDAEIKLRCLCNKAVNIDMVPAQRESLYYIRTTQGKKDLHVPGCNFEGKHQSNYHANWQEDQESGIIRVRFEDSFVIDKPKVNNNPETANDDVEDQSSLERKNTYNRTTLYAFFKRLLMDVWNVKIRRYSKALSEGKKPPYPDLAGVYKSIESHWATKIIFGKNHDLKRVLFTGKAELEKAAFAVKKQHNLCMMTLLLFEELQVFSDTHLMIKGRHLGSNKSFEMLCETYKWQDSLTSLRGVGEPYLIGGWVYNTGYGQPAEYRSIAVVPVSDNGVFVESSYERQFYNACHQQERLIIRPYNLKYYPSWSGMLPDGLFLDTPIETIVEIFGMSENQEEYHLRKNQKIAHYSKLKDARRKPYDFWYWEAYGGVRMPNLPPRN